MSIALRFGKLDFSHIAFSLLFALPVFPNTEKSYVIGIGIFGLLYYYYTEGYTLRPKVALIHSSLFLILCISLLYTENLATGFRKLGTMSSLLVVPTVLSFYPRAKIDILRTRMRGYMIIYIVAITGFCLVSFLYYLDFYRWSLFQHYPTLMNMGPYGMHPLYFSMQIIIAIIFTLYLMPKTSEIRHLVYVSLSNLVLMVFLFILLRKGPLIILSLILILFSILIYRKYLRIAVFSIIGATLLAVLIIPALNKKFEQLFNIQSVDENNITSVNIRYTIYQFSAPLLLEAMPFGFGIGDAKDELIKSFKDDSGILYRDRYNTHNQYFGLTLMGGILAISAFTLSIYMYIKSAILAENRLIIVMLALFLMFLVIENILEREAGVMYYSLFLGFFNIFSYK